MSEIEVTDITAGKFIAEAFRINQDYDWLISRIDSAMRAARRGAQSRMREQAAKVSETFFTNPYATDLTAMTTKAIAKRIRALKVEGETP